MDGKKISYFVYFLFALFLSAYEIDSSPGGTEKMSKNVVSSYRDLLTSAENEISESDRGPLRPIEKKTVEHAASTSTSVGKPVNATTTPESSDNTVIIVGAVVGGAIVLIIIVVVVVVIIIRHRRQTSSQELGTVAKGGSSVQKSETSKVTSITSTKATSKHSTVGSVRGKISAERQPSAGTDDYLIMSEYKDDKKK